MRQYRSRRSGEPAGRLLVTLVALGAMVWTPQSVRAQAADAASADRRRQVDAIFEPWAGPTPGCAVGVTRDGALDYARGYGLANLDHDIPVTPDTVFWAASISKQFTAFSIGLLVEEGRLSLDDDIRKYLPEMPDYGATITIDHLIHHTNGLREQGQLLNLAGWRGGDIYTGSDILGILTRQHSLNFKPGEEVVYGNAAYTLLGLIVERVSGQSLRAFADERIFKPLGMADTRFSDDHREVTPRRAWAYDRGGEGGWTGSIPHIDHYGSTGLLTTVGDLLTWQRNLQDARVGGPALVAWMQTSGALNDGTVTGYGAGLHVKDYKGLRLISHDGADGGYRADAALFPDQRLAIVTLCNGGAISATDLARRVAEVYLGEPAVRQVLPPAVEAPDEEISARAGIYWSPQTDEVVRLEWADGTLRQTGSSTPFIHIGRGAFRPGGLDHEWRFVPTGDGPDELHIRDFWPTTRVFTRITDPLPSPTALAALAGRYHSDETDMTYSVRVADGQLWLSWPRGYDLPLEAVGGDRFVGARGTVSFTRDPSGAVGGLTISNRRLRRLEATRLMAEEAAVAASSPTRARIAMN